MWTILGLKYNGRDHLIRNYCSCVAVGFIVFIVGYSFQEEFIKAILWAYWHFCGEIPTGILRVISWTLSIMMLASHIFVYNPFLIGSNRFFMENRESKARLNRCLYAFRTGHLLHMCWVMFLVNLYTYLWALLLLIPGVVKHYEYAMVSYVLSENPSLSTDQAFAWSKELMYGEKWNAFILDLSFIGWILPSLFMYILVELGYNGELLGLPFMAWFPLFSFMSVVVWAFYVYPYRMATWAELYGALREKAFYIPSPNRGEYPNYTAQ